MFDNCSDMVLKAIENKNPAIRMETVSFLLRVVKMPHGKTSLIKNIKVVMPLLRKLCDDMDAKVRDVAFQLIGEFIGLVGQKPINGFLENIDSTKIQLIKSFIPLDKTGSTETISTKTVTQKTEPAKETITEPVKISNKPIKPVKERLISETELEERYFQ